MVRADGALIPAGQHPFQEWNAGDGTPSAQFFRIPGGYVIRFPDMADFRVAEDGSGVECLPVADAGDRWQALYQQQVLPLLRSLTGDPVYHGAGIRIGGRAIAILGPSGRGKSTLAAAFARQGHAFLGDDCLQLRVRADGHAEVMPDQRGIRLWADSLDALAPDDARTGHVPGSPKQQLLATPGLPHCDVPTPLACAYLLGEAMTDDVRLSPLGAAQAVMAWTANAFVLDIKSPVVLRRNIEAATRLARLVPVRSLDYPRDYRTLDRVVDGIVTDLARLQQS